MDTQTEQTILLVVSPEEHRMILEALDKKIWSLVQTGLPGAYRQVPAYRRLRAEVADVQVPKNLDTGRDIPSDLD